MNIFSFIYYFRFFVVAAAIMTVTAGNSKTVAAASFGVSPSALDFTVEEGSESSRQLTIYHTGKESEFRAESSSPEAVLVFPSSGTLPEEGTAIVTITAFGKKVGASKSEIAVSINSRENGRVGVAVGAAVAVNINVIKSAALPANAFTGMVLSTSIIMFGVGAYCTSRKKVRQLLFAGT